MLADALTNFNKMLMYGLLNYITWIKYQSCTATFMSLGSNQRTAQTLYSDQKKSDTAPFSYLRAERKPPVIIASVLTYYGPFV